MLSRLWFAAFSTSKSPGLVAHLAAQSIFAGLTEKMRLGSSPLPVGAGRGGGEQVRARDHLANVRTFLAWIRAALTLMAVGYVIEKFDIIVQNHSVAFGQAGDRSVAVIVVTAGISVSVGAFLRFLAARRMIDRAVFRPRVLLDMPLIIVAAAGGILTLLYVAQVGR